MIPDMIVQEYNHSRWVFSHMDLHSGNIIVDDNFQFKGIIDWDLNSGSSITKNSNFPEITRIHTWRHSPGMQ